MTTITAAQVPHGNRYEGPRPRRPHRPATAVTALLMLGIVGSLVSTLAGNQNAGFGIIGLTATLLVWIPFAIGRCEIVSAWSAVILVVSIGCGLRGVVLATTADQELRGFFLTDKLFSDLFGPSLLFLLILAACTSGYLVAVERQPRGRSQRLRLDEALLAGRPGSLVIAAMALLGLIGSLLYIRAAGGFTPDLLTSQRRTTITTVNLAEQDSFQSYGHWEYLASLTIFAFSLHYAQSRLLRERISTLGHLTTFILLGNVLLLPIFTTTRGGLLTLVFVVAAVEAASGRRLRVSKAMLWAFVAILAASSLLGLRRGQTIEQSVWSPFQSASYLPQSVIENRNMADLGKSLLVIDATDSELERANGTTISGYAFAIVPRSAWADKPLVSPGPIVGTKVYGTRVSGVPPGMAGELVWNFGAPAGILLAGVLGALVGFSDRIGRTSRSTALGSVFLALVSMQFARDLLGVSIGRAMFTAVLSIAILKTAAASMRILGEPR